MVLYYNVLIDGAFQRRIFNVTELDYTVNYSSISVYRSGEAIVGWLPRTGGGFKTTLPRYFGSISYKAYKNRLPQSLMTEINKWDGDNVYALDKGDTLWGDDWTQGGVTNKHGAKVYAQQDGGQLKEVCEFLWGYTEIDNPDPQQGGKVPRVYFGGLFNFRLPSDEFPNGTIGTLDFGGVNPSGAYSTLDPPKISLWTINVFDDVTGSPTQGQTFKVLAENFYQPAGYSTQGVIFVDARVLSGTSSVPNPNGSDAKKNSTPNGWSGNRNPYSEEVSPTKAPNALKNSVNSTTNGMHLYKLNNDQYNALTGLFWSDQFADMIDKERFTPAMGVLSVHRLPYVPESTGSTTTVHMCGRDLYNQNWKPFEGFSKDYFYGVPITGGQEYESDPIDVEPFFNSFLDFEPYTHVSIMLPFIGIVPISTNRVMGGSIYVNYVLDNRNGNCVAQVFTKSMRNMQESVANKWSLLGQWSGNTKMPMALFGNNNGASDVMNSVRGFASSAAGSVLMGVAGVAAPEVAAAGVAASAISSGIGIATRQRPTQTISTIGTETACMSNLECRLIITRPVDVTPGHTETIDGVKIHIPDSLIEQAGLASCSGGTVNDYSGMTTGYIRGSIEGASEAEMLAIRNQFLGGVIV